MQTQTGLNEEILNLEKKYWSSMRANDFEGMMSLTDFPCIVAGPQGSHAFSKEEFKKMYESGDGRVKDYNFDDGSVEVRLVAPDTAIIAYNVKCTFVQDGKEKTIDAVDTSTWIKRDGKWVCAMHTETELTKKH